MNKDHVLAAFQNKDLPDVTVDEPMANHTTWRIGGPADVFVRPRTVEQLQAAVMTAKELEMPWTVIGRGSNLLVQDGGIRGVVIQTGDNFARIDVVGNRLTAQSGRSYVSAAGIAMRHHLAGLEFASSIPGTVGGAVMMNAGAHGSETKDVLDYADLMDADGRVERYSNQDLAFSYRYSVLKDRRLIVVQASFVLEPADGTQVMEKAKRWKKHRSDTQPLSLPNCGSVFRNPSGTHAGHLIESAGLKGLRRGDAQVSEKHANFIVNLGNARAQDVLWLMQHVQETVQKTFGIELETEVRIIGEPASGR